MSNKIEDKVWGLIYFKTFVTCYYIFVRRHPCSGRCSIAQLLKCVSLGTGEMVQKVRVHCSGGEPIWFPAPMSGILSTLCNPSSMDSDVSCFPKHLYSCAHTPSIIYNEYIYSLKCILFHIKLNGLSKRHKFPTSKPCF